MGGIKDKNTLEEMAQPLNQDLITVVNVITSEHLKEREKFILVISSVPCT